jgi:CheY-like chemotaxis protein
MLLVALSGWGQEDDKRKTKEAGFDHHLTKPAEPAELRRLLATPAPSQGPAAPVEK